MTQSIWSKLFTALRGGANEVGESIVDQQALRILDQEIRDADTALSNARRELVTIMAKHKLAADRVSEYDAKIKDLEAKAVSALNAGREDLAMEVAEAISTLTNDLDRREKPSDEFGTYAENMRKDINKAEARIKSLRQQVDMAKARDSVQKAQVSASIASGGANGKLENGRRHPEPPASQAAATRGRVERSGRTGRRFDGQRSGTQTARRWRHAERRQRECDPRAPEAEVRLSKPINKTGGARLAREDAVSNDIPVQ